MTMQRLGRKILTQEMIETQVELAGYRLTIRNCRDLIERHYPDVVASGDDSATEAQYERYGLERQIASNEERALACERSIVILQNMINDPNTPDDIDDDE